MKTILVPVMLVQVLVLAGCHDPLGTPGSQAGGLQVPPTTDPAAIAEWLAGGQYRSWHCEAQPHAARSPGAHGHTRICSNDALAAHGEGEYPVDSAAVKELYDGDRVVGFAAYRHVTAGSDGASWFWYEGKGDSTYAFGLGDSAAPREVCVACHEQAGRRSGFFGHDFVFTQVP
jgi:hypothetical protein